MELIQTPTTMTNPEVGESILNLFDRGMLGTLLWTVDDVAEFLLKVGADGVEVHPMNTIAGRQFLSGKLTRDVREKVMSLHQGFREDRSLAEALINPRRFMVAAYFLFPQMQASLKDLKSLQDSLGRDIPVVLYPSDETDNQASTLGLQNRLFQPTPELMSRYKIQTVAELGDFISQYGYSGLCLDLFHMRRVPKGYQHLDLVKNLERLIPHTRLVHVSAGRVDIPQFDLNDRINTQEELVSLISGAKGETQLDELITRLRDGGYHSNYVLEVPVMGLRSESKNIQMSQVIVLHQRMVENLRERLVRKAA